MDLLCPRCTTDLPWQDSGTIDCGGCGTEWPVVAGIPDLRLYPDPYIELIEDREKAEKLATASDDLDPAGLIDLYFAMTPEVPPSLAASYRRGILELGPSRAKDRLARIAGGSLLWSRRPRVLDLGCGAGAWLPELGARAGELTGIDVALRWLVVARKVLQHQGVNARLVCGNAEALPFRRHGCDVVIASNLLEHTTSAEATLDEVFRVLDKDGYAYVATPNRFSILPEPHVGLPGLGLLPRKAADELVRRTRGVPYGGITLHGALGWVDLVSSAGFRRVHVAPPIPGTEERATLSRPARLASRVLAAAARVPGGKTALNLVGPMLEIHAFKGPNRERVPVGRAADSS